MHHYIASEAIFTKIFKLLPLAFNPKDFRAHSIQPTTRIRAKWFKSSLQHRNLIQKDTLT
jgi:hypothetical protein